MARVVVEVQVEAVEARAGRVRRSARLRPALRGVEQIWFDLDAGEAELHPTESGDPFLLAAVMPAMESGVDVRVSGAPVSASLLANVSETQFAWRAWRGWPVVDLQAEEDDDRVPARHEFVAAFSGGVDSAYTVHQHLTESEEEYRHLCLFGQVYAALAPDGHGSLSVNELRDRWSWPENDELGALRDRHRRDHGRIGAYATRLTEGGGGTLYAEGARLQGGTRADDLIAAACQEVHADEVRHMFDDVDALRDALSADDWERLTELTMAQLRQRIVMRNAQFGNPLTPEEVAATRAGP